MFHQPVQSVTTYRLVLSRQAGASTDSRSPPLTSLPGPTDTCPPSAPFPPAPPLVTIATLSSVPSHGMCGWFHEIQARRVPSGDGVGNAKKSLPVTSCRTADGSSVAEPSSGTATMARVTLPL